MQTSTAKRFQCPHCKKSYKHPIRVLPFYCRCGAVLHEITYQYGTQVVTQVSDDLPCQFRGAELREINCGCSGKPKIYACTKHGEAYLRKLPKMTPEMIAGCTMCLSCDNRSRFSKGKLGVASVVFNQVGGTETYWRNLHKMFGLAGIATASAPKARSTLFPVFGGDEALEELADSVDTLIVWGLTKKQEATQGPKRIAIHHGSLNSVWANSVFEDELAWCEDAVAINQEVAEHYGVKYIPNALDLDSVKPMIKRASSEKTVVWLHRDAPEKRPWLARRIAEALPQGWKMIATMPPERTTSKLIAIGKTEQVADYLAQADVFLSTSDQEGFGLSMAEAMAAGVPVVASPFGLGADLRLVEQVQTEDVGDWIAAILRAGSKTDYAAEFVRSNYSLERVKKIWRETFPDLAAD